MAIRTKDRERIRKVAPITRLAVGDFRFACPQCALVRRYATEPGAVTGAAEHLRIAHRSRLTLAAPPA